MFPTGPYFRKFEIKSNLSSEVTRSLINKEFTVFILKFAISLMLVVAGFYFIYCGITSESTIKFSYNDLSLELNNVLPGVTLIIFGIVLMLFSRLNIKIKK